jgi:thiamine-phosphate diphosphorylase
VSGVVTGTIALVTDRRRLSPAARTTRDEIAALEGFLDAAIEAGVDLIQLRERDLEAGPLEDLVARVVGRTHGTAVRVLVNERADVALVAGAHGVHLSSASMPAARVRTLCPSWLIGRAVHGSHTVGEAGLDYVLFGTVFASASKPAGHRPAGLDALARVVSAAAVPVLAIGGITPAGAEACAAVGAAGVAAIGLFLPPGRSPEAMGAVPAVRALREALRRGAGGPGPAFSSHPPSW